MKESKKAKEAPLMLTKSFIFGFIFAKTEDIQT